MIRGVTPASVATTPDQEKDAPKPEVEEEPDVEAAGAGGRAALLTLGTLV